MAHAKFEVPIKSPVTQEKPFNKARKKMTILQSIFSGSVAGAVEVLFNHPLWSIKTRIQRGASFTLNPKLLYRGILPNAASMIPVTALQVSLNQCFQKLLFKDTPELSNSERLTSAFVAGVGSSLISCPTEMVMTEQGKHKQGISFYAASKYLVNQRGSSCLYSGLLSTALREGLFTIFLLAVTPILKTKIKPHCSNDLAASLLTGMGAGIGATFASQSVDTIKTIQQTSTKSVSFLNTAKNLYSLQGLPGFFKGSIPRGVRVISAVTLIGLVNEQMEKVFCSNEEEPTHTVIKC